MLTRQEAELVNETIPALRQHGEHISTVFYKSMLRDHPQLNHYFNSVNMHTGRQPRALTALILAFASNIVNISELTEKLERVAQKHASLIIRPEHYEIVGKYLLRAFSAVLGPAMTPEVNAAWTKAYWLMAKMLTGREQIIYKEFGSWTSWRTFIISAKTPETNEGDIVSFNLKPVDGQPLPPFNPGLYVTIRVKIKGLKYFQLRQYSLSDAPNPESYRITIKRDVGAGPDTQADPRQYSGFEEGPPLSSAASSASDSSIGSIRPHRPGLVSNVLIDDFQVGDTLDLTHPVGEYFVDANDPNTNPLILISAGVGCAPLYPMLKVVAEQGVGRPVSWIQASRHDAPFREKVEKIAQAYPNVRCKFFRSRLADGDVISLASRFQEDFIGLNWEDLWLTNNLAEYYVCGPEKFMSEIGNHLLKNRVEPARIKYELYSVGTFEMKR
ncbi:globin-like protein [Xylaria bambusicola]|uniref:globin-like protein n=1 Tax=Xylaria bambusicola TaxID=326684 RepID=UPI002007CF0A|nr:globin-like protein [Xylaria bambusicola]KAI0521711.1 globin-like protein [Xylaria bambusicola]